MTQIVRSFDKHCDWNDDGFCFTCPVCETRLNTGWFLSKGSYCNECGSEVIIQARIEDGEVVA